MTTIMYVSAILAIEEAKAAFIDFLPAGTVILSALLITIFLTWILDKI